MLVSMISLELPPTLYRRLQRLVELTHRPLEKLVIEALDINVPPLLDELLRKAYATALLKWRGYSLPPLPAVHPSSA
jgi:hypothetical protein